MQTCVQTYAYICVDMVTIMCVGVRTINNDMNGQQRYVHTCVGMCVGMFAGMCVGMCINVCAEVSTLVCVGICRHVCWPRVLTRVLTCVRTFAFVCTHHGPKHAFALGPGKRCVSCRLCVFLEDIDLCHRHACR